MTIEVEKVKKSWEIRMKIMVVEPNIKNNPEFNLILVKILIYDLIWYDFIVISKKVNK